VSRVGGWVQCGVHVMMGHVMMGLLVQGTNATLHVWPCGRVAAKSNWRVKQIKNEKCQPPQKPQNLPPRLAVRTPRGSNVRSRRIL
jgi:hypothetical protein